MKIVLIHGMWCRAETLSALKDALTQAGHEVFVPTLPFHVPSSNPPPELGSYRLIDYVSYLTKEIKAKGWEKPVLIGHSMGGWLAQALAAEGLASRLVLFAPAAPRGIFPLGIAPLYTLLEVPFKWKFWAKPFQPTFRGANFGLLNRIPKEKRRELYNSLNWESGRALFELAFWFFDPFAGNRIDANKVDCPVLVLAGKEDRIIPNRVTKAIARRYSNSEYEVFPGHAHWLVDEPGKEKIYSVMLDWLKRNSK
ncbi:alpha/beta hydrolase [Leptospira wolffii]|uniref:alpha/beta hydrolase n=1 Tax=Leptospira wolffii TaxID=409998 RepID=UPI001082AE9C|nr:alpha/beta hydrolase [Leptospira wolffii]TGK64655.1 alpha/beta hydrolase [Leptospira wolffii]TGK72743.1 alpha/beta hydrolase [Leptospira wolffii]TGK76946.1 alpha/beta hydrolase [Leptospira wolffii]TGL26597.1 alpha/beta hydrolase [Leptospira wolffii]